MFTSDAVGKHLLDTSAITDITGDRIYQIKLPQGCIYPAIAFQLIGGWPQIHTAGDTDDQNPKGYTYQITAFAEKITTCRNALEAAKDAMEDYMGSMASAVTVQRAFTDTQPVEIWNEEANVYQISQDFTVVWIE